MADAGDSTRRRRRLAAILMADVVGFSQMMGRDDQGTTARILDFHERVRITVEAHGGRVVGTAGDSVFGDFDSIVEALDCAAEIQQGLHLANVDVPEGERIEARIGLHLGDVIVEEYNIFGDGVNIAARLEQLADPGGIVLSEAVFQQVKSSTDLPIEEMGTRTLKNIEQPLRLYRIGPDALGGDRVGRSPGSRDSEAGKSEAGQAIREAVESALERVAQEIDRSQRESKPVTEQVPAGPLPSEQPQARPRRRKGVIASVFDPGTLVITAIGVLLMLARTSGWSDNGWYPFIGVFMLGLAAGMMLKGLTGLGGPDLLMMAGGTAVGAAFFDNVVLQAILWVIAAAMLGNSLQMIRRSWRRAHAADLDIR